jgi:hypothetical protein
VNPNAQQALDRLKVETAAELGLQNYQNTYKGALTSADNGRVGGNMVRKMIQSQEQQFGGQSQQGQQGQQTLTTKYDVNKK